jgi:hypothetical protein
LDLALTPADKLTIRDFGAVLNDVKNRSNRHKIGTPHTSTKLVEKALSKSET